MAREAVPATPRKAMGKARRKAVWDAHSGLCGLCSCPVTLGAPTVMDHKTPLELGGMDDLANLWPLCQGCNKTKTRRDIAQIAKMRRIHKQEKPREPSRMRSRGFDKSLSKRMDGRVIRRRIDQLDRPDS